MMAGSLGFCLQQPFPSGPPEAFAGNILSPLEELEDRTLAVHCLAVGQPGAADDPHRRQGLGTSMVRTLVEWARARGWRAIEATTYVDLDILYRISGAAGRSFWEKLGFQVAGTSVEPELEKESDVLQSMRAEARARGIPPERLADKYTMRLELA
jgi:GNAT superfamily N-acetyltransferase